jgi:glycosyltransferase involved in cell wall biosynthesis
LMGTNLPVCASRFRLSIGHFATAAVTGALVVHDSAPLDVNILFCTLDYYPSVTGGAERQARLQAEELARRGHHVTVVCARTDKLRSGEIDGVRIVRLRRVERRHLVRMSYLARLFVWLLRHGAGYQVVHVHLANLQADVAVLAARFHGLPSYVKVACGGAVGEVQRMRRVARFSRWYGLRHADRVQVLSREIRNELAAIGVSERRMVEIPNGIDLERFRPITAAARGRIRNELGLPQDAVIALFAGRLVEYKGIDDLFAAWPSVRVDEAQLLLVGATDQRELAAPPGVIVRGWARSPLPYLRAADVFVHPSHADGMSNSVLEAMACGCAVVATEHGATEGLLTHGADALLVPVRDPASLAAALERVLTDSDLRADMASRSLAMAGRYRIGDVVNRIEAEYRRMLDGRGSCTEAGQMEYT